MRKCAFCPNDAVERGGEHVWDDWLNRSLPVRKHRVRYSDTTGTKREYATTTLDEKLPVVCEACNNRWMSQITHHVKLCFESVVVDGRKLCILPSGCVLLATFLFMKAAVAASHIAQNDDAFLRAPKE